MKIDVNRNHNIMGKIHILDEATVNKIAAGEVIERPASVVKELIENSIDSGADNIKIEIINSGKDLIQITDNGCGMTKDDASNSFLKHATSKIKTIEDIETITSMGFRGEALASISAISKIEIITKTKEELSGTKVVVHGNRLINITDIGSPYGTKVKVEDLFYNTPARRKYLKSDITEFSHIVDIVIKNSLGYNNISFTLIHNGVEILSSHASELKDVILHIYGQDVAKTMLSVNFESKFAKIMGLISLPDMTRASSDIQFFYINNRNITSKALSSALKEGYGTLIPKGRFPFSILKLYIDTKEVDVNVHPTKSQVRLSHEKESSDTLIEAVKLALSKDVLIPDITLSEKEHYKIPFPILKEAHGEYRVSLKNTEKKLKYSERIGEKQNKKPENVIIPEIEFLGQIDALYLVARAKNGLIIIDQHAAHERVLYEQALKLKRNNSQELIVPIHLELDFKEKVLIKDCIPYLEEMGFKIVEFGVNSFAVSSVPDILINPNIVHDIIIDLIKDGKMKNKTELFERITKSIACRGAIKSGAECSIEQMQNLITQLFKTKTPYTCPHGRPVMISLSRDELDKLFKRK